MAMNPNPAEKTASDADYDKKFNKQEITAEAKKLKEQEAAQSAEWKITRKKKRDDDAKQGRFRFLKRRGGAVKNGSAVAFVVGIIALGVFYTSIFAPNIILVNIKEMYTNDLADATIALDAYYWKLMSYKIGMSQCNDVNSIKCKLSTMSRAQKEAFEKQGFFVMGDKVKQDDRDTGENGDVSAQPESRYKVSLIVPPVYAHPEVLIASGDLLRMYSKVNDTTKALTYGVFNPKSSFFMDTKFRQRLLSKYALTKTPTVSGTTEQQVDQSFNQSMTGSGEGLDTNGRPNTTGGIGLGSLGSPAIIPQLEAAMEQLVTPTTTYTGIQCAWYSLGKAVTNNAKSAKAHTLARFAMQYLKAADQIKIGTSEEITINTLASKVAESVIGGTEGQNATDMSIYKSIVYGDIALPSQYGFLYNLSTYDLYGFLAPAWSQIMASAAEVGRVSGVAGTLAMPPINLTGSDRQYCLGGESPTSKEPIKEDKCESAIIASAPPGFQGALEHALLAGRQNCPMTHYDLQDNQIEGQWIMAPPVQIVAQTLSSYITTLFSANVMVWANATNLFYNANTKGTAASEAIFAGTGEILGDMAMSRGMMPSNALSLAGYLAQKPAVEKDFEDVARYNAKKTPFDIYNKYSFMGSIVHSLAPTYDAKTPLFSSIANSFSVLGSALKRLNPNANAIYYLQPDLSSLNPARMICPDPEYLAIGITADIACNVRYSMGLQELAAQPDNVIDYMLKAHPDLTQDSITELQERLAAADQEGDKTNVGRMLASAQAAAEQPQINQYTGAATPGSEYEKFLEYCVNRQDPWGRSGIASTHTSLPNDIKQKLLEDKDGNGLPISWNDSGNPYQQIASTPYPSISEGASADQDWYTGKKCTEQSEELTNFRAYTMLCSVDGSLSGGYDCTDLDNSNAAGYTDSFYTSNDILYVSWY